MAKRTTDWDNNTRLAGKIRRYWAAKGYTVDLTVEETPLHNVLPGDDCKDPDRNPLCQIRSNMVGGLPVTKPVAMFKLAAE